ncbi:Threonine-phosphate decarboxylase [Azospirillaceae bacterium]
MGPILDHGGSLTQAEARFGRPKQPWVDLSTGINPWPYPIEQFPDSLWARLPETSALHDLIEAATSYYGAPDSSHVAAAPGSQALIQLLPSLSSPGRVGVLEPTYAEHALCRRRAGWETLSLSRLPTPDEIDNNALSTVIVVHPNNPDGRLFTPEALTALGVAFAERGGLVIVDEAFADVVPTHSVANQVGQDKGLCILRSFGKFFGLAGARLGFALTAPTLATQITEALGPWSINGPTLCLGQRALSDYSWIAATRARLTESAQALDALLRDCNLNVIGGTSLYRLIKDERAPKLYERCGRAGILLRAFSQQPQWLRIGLPKDEHSAKRLSNALKTALDDQKKTSPTSLTPTIANG